VGAAPFGLIFGNAGRARNGLAAIWQGQFDVAERVLPAPAKFIALGLVAGHVGHAGDLAGHFHCQPASHAVCGDAVAARVASAAALALFFWASC